MEKWDKKHREWSPWALPASPLPHTPHDPSTSWTPAPSRGQGGLGGQSRVRAGLAAAGKLECFPDLLAKHHVGEEDEGAQAGRKQQL